MSLYDSGVRQIIDDYLLEESKKRRNYGDYWSASNAGYCLRRVIFDRLQLPEVKPDPRKQRVFTSGHIFHNWIQELTKAAGCSIAQEDELQDEDIMVRGHFDDLIRTPEGIILYDYKTASSRSFGYKKEMSYFHRLQVGTYLYMMRKKLVHPGEKSILFIKPGEEVAEARILVLEKDTLRTKEFQLMWTPLVEQDVLGYWNKLNAAWALFQKERRLPPCTCHEHEGGFLAKEAYNPYFFDGEPCSMKWARQELPKLEAKK